MKDRVTVYRNGCSVYFEKNGAWYRVILRDANGYLQDKVRCDDYRAALDYYRSYKAIARAAQRTTHERD